MNLNILAYVIYGCITIYIIYKVGKLCHSNGRIFILELFQNDAAKTNTTNNLLLIAYYLFNIGYAVLQISSWRQVKDVASLVASVADKCGVLIILLAILHYFNMSLIYILSKRKHSITI